MLTEKEFFDLIKFTIKGADTSDVPILSREQARAFFLRFIREVGGPAGVEVVFDVDGSTLSPSSRATWAEDKARARAADRLLLAVRINGKTEIHEFPRKFLNAPIQMTQNLSDDDWDELALLQATQTLKGHVLRKGR